MMNIQKGLLAKGRGVAENFLHLGMIQVSNALVQILLFPFIIRKTGLEAFGPVVVANSFTALMGLLVNYGTSISGVQAVAAAQNDKRKLSTLFSQTLALRAVLLILPLLSLPVVKELTPAYFGYILMAMPLVLAELINPLYFYNGSEQLRPFNIGNLLSKLVAAMLILSFVDGPEAAKWVNFFLGLSSLVLFGILNLYLFRTRQLRMERVEWKIIRRLLRQNLPLAGNNLSVQLQQSFFLFVLSGTGNAVLLGAYAIADKVLWGFRLVLIAFSNALFPKAVVMTGSNPGLARLRKQQINMALAILFILVALVLYLEPELIVQIFAGKALPMAATLIRAIAFVPLLVALNALNVIEMLVHQRYRDIFKIALVLTGITIVSSLLIIRQAEMEYIVWYPFIIELAALLLYMIFLTRKTQAVRVA